MKTYVFVQGNIGGKSIQELVARQERFTEEGHPIFVQLPIDCKITVVSDEDIKVETIANDSDVEVVLSTVTSEEVDEFLDDLREDSE